MGYGHIGFAIRAARREKGEFEWTTTRLAREVPMGRSMLAMVESGRRQIQEAHAHRIEELLGVKFTNVDYYGWYKKVSAPSRTNAIGVQMSLLPRAGSDKPGLSQNRSRPKVTNVTSAPGRRKVTRVTTRSRSDKKRRRA